ncbi:MAG: hypothetical protein KAJ39_05050 [Gammaproteobacteria bacterium]|nr:hypothetical protein [Gammaproteobacteria bacterium]
MKHKRWIGSYEWETADQNIDRNLSFNERCHTETQDIDDLIHWLEYANTGYPAARQSVDQEEYWAKLIRNLLCEKLIKHLVFFDDSSYQCNCSHCNAIFRGTVYHEDVTDVTVTIGMLCEHLESRKTDILLYIEDKMGEWL